MGDLPRVWAEPLGAGESLQRRDHVLVVGKCDPGSEMGAAGRREASGPCAWTPLLVFEAGTVLSAPCAHLSVLMVNFREVNFREVNFREVRQNSGPAPRPCKPGFPGRWVICPPFLLHHRLVHRPPSICTS